MTKVKNNLTRREQFIMAAMQAQIVRYGYLPATGIEYIVKQADATIAYMDATALEHSPLEKEMD